MKIGYARVSTSEQSLDMQIKALKDNEVTKIYEEKISGVSKSMPERNKLLKAVKKDDTIVFYKLDRLGRSLADIINFLAKVEEKGAKVQSITEGFNTDTIAGKMIANIIMSLAEYERNLIIERTKAGLKSARENGVLLGRRPKVTKQKLKLAKEMLASGYTQKYVADCIDVNVSTLYRHLNKK